MNSFGARASLDVAGRTYEIYRLRALEERGLDIRRLPFSLRILLENLLRTEDGVTVTADDIEALASWRPGAPEREIAFTPARALRFTVCRRRAVERLTLEVRRRSGTGSFSLTAQYPG